jgi:hypothetical protein
LHLSVSQANMSGREEKLKLLSFDQRGI